MSQLFYLSCPKKFLYRFSSFMPNEFSHLINWTSPFSIFGLSGGIFHFDSNFDRLFCKQTVETLIRSRRLRRLIWVCTVCRCPTKRTLGLYGLIIVRFGSDVFNRFRISLRSVLLDYLCVVFAYDVVFHAIKERNFLLLSCQPRVTVTSVFVYKVFKDL